MVKLQGVAHFSIAVSDMARSKPFYTDIVGCRHLFTLPNNKMCFLDAGGMCIILVERPGPINRDLDDHNGVHHSFMIDSADYKAALDHLRANDIEITFDDADDDTRRIHLHARGPRAARILSSLAEATDAGSRA